jgi:alpha-1,3-glucan synthase
MWGFDAGIPSTMVQVQDDLWELEVMDKWPSNVQLNVFGYSDYFYGDTDGDGIMERLPPNSAAPNYLNLSAPPYPHLSWTLVVNDSSLRWSLTPKGHSAIGAAMFTLLAVMPVLTAIAAVMIFRWSFYGIKHNEWGFIPSRTPYYSLLPGFSKNKHTKDYPLGSDRNSDHVESQERIGWPELPTKRRKVLIATLEYEIMDWNCKVKIGGLGVMATLMGKAMTDVDLIWVVPKVGDIEYPPGEPSDPFEVVIFGERYLVEVETHNWAHIKYIILDSPVFRAQTKADPYPSRMDDLSSAIFYSTWNQAIAATIRRFPAIDVYHINDYHGALAPIYLLPKVIPVCLSLHNAEFQGLWPLRTREDMQEV